MKKILNFFYVEDYRRDMTKIEKFHRDNKIAFILLLALAFFVISYVPIYAKVVPIQPVHYEWICPNKSCKYDNMNGIRYCGVCGTEKGTKPR
jgi:ABC-type polysaccharide transport system permease subunit